MTDKILLGKFELYFIANSSFKLDGGAMFGVVPKVIWEKLTPADEKNRILLGINPMLIKASDKWIITDPGIGDKFDEKNSDIFALDRKYNLDFALKDIGLTPEDINIVILSHLHFDHAGALTRLDEKGRIVPTFSNAIHYIQKGEWEEALSPNERSRASYIKENYLAIKENSLLRLIEGDTEIMPGIKTIVTGGHTESHQIVLIESEKEKACFMGDFLPTSYHCKLPYIMAYDLFPHETLNQRKKLFKKAAEENWLICLMHDPYIRAGYLKLDDKNYFLVPRSLASSIAK